MEQNVHNYPRLNYPFLYKYHELHGYYNFNLRYIFNILVSSFITAIVVVVYSIDWKEIISCTQDSSCKFQKDKEQPIILQIFIFGNVSILLIYILINLVYLIGINRYLKKTHRYIRDELEISDQEFMIISWENFIKRIADRHGLEYIAFNVHVSNQIMNDKNQLIKISRYGQINWGHSAWTQISEFILLHFVITYSDDDNLELDKIRKKYKIYGILSIFIVMFFFLSVIVIITITESERYHAKVFDIGGKNWTVYSKRLFQRENELPHLLKTRLYSGKKHANKILNRYSNPIHNSIGKFLSSISAGVMTLITFFALLNDNILLYMNIYNRNLLSYLGIFSVIFTLSRMMINEREYHINFDLDNDVDHLVTHTGYDDFQIPLSYHLKTKIEKLYKSRFTLVFMELASFFMMPYYFFKVLPNNLTEFIDVMHSQQLVDEFP